MIEFIKWFFGRFSGKTEEYDKMVEVFASTQKTISTIREESERERDRHKEEIRLWIQRENQWRTKESEYHNIILDLRSKVNTLTMEVEKLKNKLNA